MNVLRAIKVAELRKKLAVIPGKLILALLILVGIFFYRNRTMDLMVLWELIKSDWLFYVGALVFLYGAVSYFTFFMQMLKQWFLGLVASVGTIAALYFTVGQRDNDIFMIIVFVMVIIGPFFDTINFFRYFRLKNQVIEAEEELKESIGNSGGHDSAYDDGFEEGYRRGINAGKRDSEGAGERIKEKHKKRIREEYKEEYEEDPEDYIEEGSNSEDWDSEDAEDIYSDGYDFDEDGFREDGFEGEYNSSDWDTDEERNYSGNNNKRTVKGDSGNIAGYFADCKNKREIKRRYHDLCKVYHPDSGNASSDIFCKINAEYLVLMSQYEE